MTKPLTDTEKTVIEAAIRCFLRFGARKTSMNDIAAAAGVSRQTIYDLFGGKDDLIRACIRSITDENLADIRAALGDNADLGVQLDTYFQKNVVQSFEMMRVSDDPQDLVTGHNAAGKAEIDASRDKHMELLAEWLRPHSKSIESAGYTAPSLARFVVAVSMAFKYEARDRAELDDLLSSLKTTVLAAAGTS